MTKSAWTLAVLRVRNRREVVEEAPVPSATAADGSRLRAASPSESAARAQADVVTKVFATRLTGSSVVRSSARNSLFFSEQ